MYNEQKPAFSGFDNDKVNYLLAPRRSGVGIQEHVPGQDVSENSLAPTNHEPSNPIGQGNHLTNSPELFFSLSQKQPTTNAPNRRQLHPQRINPHRKVSRRLIPDSASKPSRLSSLPTAPHRTAQTDTPWPCRSLAL